MYIPLDDGPLSGGPPVPPTIYVSSKRAHAQTWLTYRARKFNIISSWIDLNEILSVEEVGRLWPVWIEEAARSDYLIFWAKPGEDSHEGSLIEIGACLAAGGHVLHVGVSETMKTGNGELADFTHHPKWLRITDLETAFKIASLALSISEYISNI